MKLTPVTPICQVYLADVPHYLVPDVMIALGVSERQVYRYFEDGVLTKCHYPEPDSKGVCVPAAEVHALDNQRLEERANAQRPSA